MATTTKKKFDPANFDTSRGILVNNPLSVPPSVSLSDDGSFVGVDQSEVMEHNLGRNGMPYNVMQRFMDARAKGDYLTAAQFDALIKSNAPDFDIPSDVDPVDYAKRIMPSTYQSPAELGRFASYIARLQQDESARKQKASAAAEAKKKASERSKFWDEYFESLKTEDVNK